MKVITWNCNGAFRKKYHLLDQFDADLLIIQECEDPEHSDLEYKNWASSFLWVGGNKNKGLGIFGRKKTRLEKMDWPDSNLQLFLPCRVNGAFNLLAVWTKQANSPNFRYIGQLWKYLQLNKDKLSQGGTLICGDFNSNKQWDEWDRWWNHSDVVRELNEIGIHSIYHELTSEEQGKESKPTLFLQRKREKPYHIDYAFASESMFTRSLENIEIGTPDIWLDASDHMPVIFNINAS